MFCPLRSPSTHPWNQALSCHHSHTLSMSSLFLPIHLAPATSTFLQADTQSSTLLCSKPPQSATPHHIRHTLYIHPEDCRNLHYLSYPSATPQISYRFIDIICIQEDAEINLENPNLFFSLTMSACPWMFWAMQSSFLYHHPEFLSVPIKTQDQWCIRTNFWPEKERWVRENLFWSVSYLLFIVFNDETQKVKILYKIILLQTDIDWFVYYKS